VVERWRGFRRQSVKTLVAFDIDGVIRDVTASYRRALMDTVEHFGGYRPTMAEIDLLKAEGLWNNDWLGSQELLRRQGIALPNYPDLVAFFQERYLGSPLGTGYIANETLLVTKAHFQALEAKGLAYGFFSGASRFSARTALGRLGLPEAPLVAMEDGPEKPDPTGLLALADRFNCVFEQIFYLGDTVADMSTVKNAKPMRSEIQFIGIGIIPPHLWDHPGQSNYREKLRQSGATLVWERFPEPDQFAAHFLP
jgi:HAD superfamily phosphatase